MIDSLRLANFGNCSSVFIRDTVSEFLGNAYETVTVDGKSYYK